MKRVGNDASAITQDYIRNSSLLIKPTLDILLFSKRLSAIMGWTGPLVVIAWYLFSGFFLKFLSSPFGKLIAGEQRLEGEYRASQTALVQHAEEIAFFRGNEWEKTRVNSIFYVEVGLVSASSATVRAS